MSSSQTGSGMRIAGKIVEFMAPPVNYALKGVERVKSSQKPPAGSGSLYNFVNEPDLTWLKYVQVTTAPGPDNMKKYRGLDLGAWSFSFKFEKLYERDERIVSQVFHSGRPGTEFDHVQRPQTEKSTQSNAFTKTVADLVNKAASLKRDIVGPSPTRDNLYWEEGYEIELEIQKNDTESENQAVIKIHNVHPDLHSEFEIGRMIRVEAGWINDYDLIFTGKINLFHVERDGTDTVCIIKAETWENYYLDAQLTFNKDQLGLLKNMHGSDVIKRICEMYNFPIGYIEVTPYYRFTGDLSMNAYSMAEILEIVTDWINMEYNLYEDGVGNFGGNQIKPKVGNNETTTDDYSYGRREGGKTHIRGRVGGTFYHTPKSFSWMIYYGRLYWMRNEKMLPNGMILSPYTGLLSYKFETTDEGDVQYKANHLFLPHITEGMTVRIVWSWILEGMGFFEVLGVKHVSDDSTHETQLLLQPIDMTGESKIAFYDYGGWNSRRFVGENLVDRGEIPLWMDLDDYDDIGPISSESTERPVPTYATVPDDEADYYQGEEIVE